MGNKPHQSFDPSALAPWQGAAIILLDLDAFFAAVEQLDHPEWRGKPVIVGGSPDKRGVVSTCSYEARKFGVRSAMASARAAKLCPDAIWTPGNFPRYIELSNRVMQIMSDVSPRIQQVSIDEAFLDISPGRFVKDHPVMLAHTIRSKVAELGITCSIGLGTSKSVAKIASDMEKPDGLTVIYPGMEQAFLFPLPIRTMSGVGRQSEKRLNDFGIFTLGELANADEGVLKGIFGKNSTMMRNRCLGLNDSEVLSDDEVKSVSNEMTFSTDLREREEIKQSIEMISAKVGRRLRHKGLAGYTVSLKVRYEDLSFANVQHTLDRPVDDEHEFAPVLVELLDQVWEPGTGLRLIGVAVASFQERPEQLSLFGDDLTAGMGTAGKNAPAKTVGDKKQPRKKPKRALVEATDKVKNRFGEDAVGYGRELRFRERDTGTIAQKKDDYKDPLN
ncbi:MAG TPA: DNA polymerase IV [Coriobacteriia bacterium]|nr:DNA polymerase IV [Coriobacteriia bacterium]